MRGNATLIGMLTQLLINEPELILAATFVVILLGTWASLVLGTMIKDRP